jgi:diaminopimelate decarboxylase
LEAWRDWGLGVEVVSAYELMAALDARMPPRRILVNGVAKHTWLTTFDVCELNVHFDSLREVERLGQIAHRRGWRVGVRCQVPNQRDPENQEFADQFGMCLEEAVRAVCFLSRCGVAVSGLHFHLGGNVASTREYIVALHHLRRVADACRLEPTYVDIGGGLPPEGHHFDWEDYGGLDVRIRDLFPSVREVWFENGRHITAGAGALVATVLDRKDREESAYLICDGGRVNHARPAAWAAHDVLVHPPRIGPARLTTVCGPTSAGIDKLGRWELPQALTPGDLLIWLEAGAYHIPLETRFSAGLAPVVWFASGQPPRVIRKRETAAEWWGQWT